MKLKLKSIFEVMVAVAIVITGFVVAAEETSSGREEAIGGERVQRAPAAASRGGLSRKRYPGGADEDDLQVQATLPIPSRTLDGSSAIAAPIDTDAVETAPPPAND